MKCKNCGKEVSHNYCPHCGQSAKVNKISWKNFVSDITESVLQVNHGFFFTVKQLFVRPGSALHAYLAGKRQSFVKPITHAFALSTLYFLLARLTDNVTFLDDFIAGWGRLAEAAELAEDSAKAISYEFQLGILAWFAKHYAYSILLLLPVYAFASYLAFLKVGLNYLEHLVINAYITGQQAIFYCIFALLGMIIGQGDLVVNLTLITSLAYSFFVFYQMFAKTCGLSFFVRYLGVYVIAILMQVMLMMLIFALGGAIFM